MTAIAVSTFERERFDVIEGFFYRLAHIPQLQLAHSRRVDQEPAVRQEHQLPVRRRVPSLRVGLANVPCLLNLAANETIDDRALAHTRRAEERSGLSRR